MGDKKRTEEWYEKINKQFLEDSKTHDYSNPEMDKWFVEMLNKKMGEKDEESVDEWYERLNKQFLEDSKTHDYSEPEMDKWFAKMLDEKMGEEDEESVDEWYERLNKQFLEDSKTHDYRDPEMDKWFAEMLDKEVRKSRRRKIAKVASIAAGIVLVLSVVLNGFTQVVYGESLIDIIRNSIEAGNFTISAIAPNNKSNEFDEYDNITLLYEADSMEELFRQIIDDEHIEVSQLFCVQDLPSEYTSWTAKYNSLFQTLTVNSRQKDKYLYIYEELNYEKVVSGTILESEIISTVYNKSLDMNINIIIQMAGVRGSGYYIEVFYDNMRIKIEGNGTLEEFESMAKNISAVVKD